MNICMCIADTFMLTCVVICSSNPRKENKEPTNNNIERTIVGYLQKPSSER